MDGYMGFQNLRQRAQESMLVFGGQRNQGPVNVNVDDHGEINEVVLLIAPPLRQVSGCTCTFLSLD